MSAFSTKADPSEFNYRITDRLFTYSGEASVPFTKESSGVVEVFFTLDSAELRHHRLQIGVSNKGKFAIFCNGRLIKIFTSNGKHQVYITSDDFPNDIGNTLNIMIYAQEGSLRGDNLQLNIQPKSVHTPAKLSREPILRNTSFLNRNIRIVLIWASLFLSVLVIRNDPTLLLESILPSRFLTNNSIKDLTLSRFYQLSDNFLLLLVILFQVFLLALIKSQGATLIEVIETAFTLLILFLLRFAIIPFVSALFEMGRLANLHIAYSLRTMSVLFVFFSTIYLLSDLVLNIDQQTMASLQIGLIIFFTLAVVANIFSTLLRSYAQINLRFISYICTAELLPMLYLVQFL